MKSLYLPTQVGEAWLSLSRSPINKARVKYRHPLPDGCSLTYKARNVVVQDIKLALWNVMGDIEGRTWSSQVEMDGSTLLVVARKGNKTLEVEIL